MSHAYVLYCRGAGFSPSAQYARLRAYCLWQYGAFLMCARRMVMLKYPGSCDRNDAHKSEEELMRVTQKLIPFSEIPESFSDLVKDGNYYVDKTGFIRFLIECNRRITVFTRPRRFGKTLMLRTLQAFFEYACDNEGNVVDNRCYFEGLKVMNAGENVLKHFGQYPVISLSLKDVSGDTYESVIAMLRKAVCDACQAHFQLLLRNSALIEEEQQLFRRYATKTATENELKGFLSDMCMWLKRITNRKTVILLDEYDVPLQQAAIYDNHHPNSDLFDKTVRLIRKFISAGFKSNNDLAMMNTKLNEAEHQIDLRKYIDGIAIHYPVAKEVYCYALCFCRKLCMARLIEG